MLPNGWQDRVPQKQNLSNWINSNDPAFVLSVSDSHEISDIENWLQSKTANWLIAQAPFAPDTEILKYNLLEFLVFDLGENYFSGFRNALKLIPNLAPINISQSMGDNAKAKDDIQFENNSQSLDIQLDGKLVQSQYYYEKNILQIFGAFINDLKQLARKHRILLIIKFKGEVLAELSADFLNWFEDQFLVKLGQTPNVKICVISQGDIDTLSRINEDQKGHLTTLSLKDIIAATKQHIDQNQEFCYGVVDPDTETVEYKEFKRKLHARLRRVAE